MSKDDGFFKHGADVEKENGVCEKHGRKLENGLCPICGAENNYNKGVDHEKQDSKRTNKKTDRYK
ncbi:MAG: hypothetical protein QXQ43_04500 [Nitrososphaerota archaeon]